MTFDTATIEQNGTTAEQVSTSKMKLIEKLQRAAKNYGGKVWARGSKCRIYKYGGAARDFAEIKIVDGKITAITGSGRVDADDIWQAINQIDMPAEKPAEKPAETPAVKPAEINEDASIPTKAGEYGWRVSVRGIADKLGNYWVGGDKVRIYSNRQSTKSFKFVDFKFVSDRICWEIKGGELTNADIKSAFKSFFNREIDVEKEMAYGEYIGR